MLKTSVRKFQHPLGLYILTLGELCERFCYYGTQMLLVLYLTKVFHFTDNASYSLYGAYAAFAFALPVLGGILADRLIGFRHAIATGYLLLITGNLLLALPSYPIFCLGLAVSLVGIGLYKANSTTLVGLLYAQNDIQRESGYTFFYMGMNIGGTLGPIIYGLIIYRYGWHVGFILSAFILTINLIIFLHKNNKHFPIQLIERATIKLSNKFHYSFIYAAIGITCLLISMLLSHADFFSNFIITFTVIALIYLIINTLQQPIIFRKRIFSLLILFVFIACFFAASLQVGSSINLFIDRFINRYIFGWQIPALIFTSLYPFFVIIMAPLISMLWQFLASHQREPSIISKILIGLFLASAGFICFSLATLTYHYSYLAYLWIIVGNACLSIGELCIAPTIFTAISRLAPHNLQGTVMGSVFLFIALGGYLSGIIAKLRLPSDLLLNSSAAIYLHTFMGIVGFTIIIAAILFVIKPFINKLISINV